MLQQYEDRKNRFLIPSRKKDILSSPQRKDGHSLLPSRYQSVLPYREVVSGREAHLTTPSSTEIKETWICNSTTHLKFIGPYIILIVE
jgi:hypothetical protein